MFMCTCGLPYFFFKQGDQWYDPSIECFPKIDEERKIILEIETNIETWIKQLQNQEISEYLINWKSFPIEDVTWEDDFFKQGACNVNP